MDEALHLLDANELCENEIVPEMFKKALVSKRLTASGRGDLIRILKKTVDLITKIEFARDIATILLDVSRKDLKLVIEVLKRVEVTHLFKDCFDYTLSAYNRNEARQSPGLRIILGIADAIIESFIVIYLRRSSREKVKNEYQDVMVDEIIGITNSGGFKIEDSPEKNEAFKELLGMSLESIVNSPRVSESSAEPNEYPPTSEFEFEDPFSDDDDKDDGSNDTEPSFGIIQ